jgi:hypothetical protein
MSDSKAQAWGEKATDFSNDDSAMFFLFSSPCRFGTLRRNN